MRKTIGVVSTLLVLTTMAGPCLANAPARVRITLQVYLAPPQNSTTTGQLASAADAGCTTGQNSCQSNSTQYTLLQSGETNTLVVAPI